MLLLVVSTLSCRSTTDETPVKIPVAQLKEDFRILRTTLEEAHPGLYWYTSRPAMNQYFDSTYRLLTRDMTDLEFFKVVLPLIAQIRCVHTNLGFSEKTKSNPSMLRKLLPLDVYYSQGRAYIREDFDEAAAHEGLEIRAINQVPIGQLTTHFMTVLPTDGYNETHKYYLLEQGAFREGYALLMGQPDQFVIDAVDAGTNTHVQLILPAKSPRELTAFLVSKQKNPPAPEISLAINAQTAILTIRTFTLSQEKFSHRVNQLVDTIRRLNVPRLIIDLRSNGGGDNGNVSVLFAHLSTSPFRHLKQAQINKPLYTNLPYVVNPSAIQDLKGTATENGTYTVNYLYPGTALTQPAYPLVFKGKVAVLVNGGTVSAASEFAALVHSYKRGLIVGEETGGCYYGATGGRYLKLVLPHSGLNVQIPIIRIFTNVTEDVSRQPTGRGVLPDYAIRPTIRDILANKDPQMERALQVVAER